MIDIKQVLAQAMADVETGDIARTRRAVAMVCRMEPSAFPAPLQPEFRAVRNAAGYTNDNPWVRPSERLNEMNRQIERMPEGECRKLVRSIRSLHAACVKFAAVHMEDPGAS